jgi:hypothetical protein
MRHAIAARLLAVLGVVVLAANGTPAAASSLVRGTGLQLLARLATAPEHPRGYSRSLFVHWIDADGDGCDTRGEVLIAESRTTARIGPGCSIAGSWRSVYDGVTTTKASSFDIDHVVALKEAWDSGAWKWTPARRQGYANDLGNARSLRAVSPWTGGDTPVDQAWLDRYDQLKAAADQALSAADRAWSTWVARMRHQ